MVGINRALEAVTAAVFLLSTASAMPHNIDATADSAIEKRSTFFANNPLQGVPYITIYPNEAARNSAQAGTGREDDLRISVRNEETQPVWVWAEHNNNDGHTDILHPDRPWERKIKLNPGESLEMGHFPEPSVRPGDGSKFSGSVRAYRGCNEIGEQCADQLDATTKFEYAADPYGHRNNIGINLSLVDGLSTRGYFSYGEGSNCPFFGCTALDDQVRGVCPASHLKTNGGVIGCLSDCKATGNWADCFSETMASSRHLHELCPTAYAWSADHQGTYADCNPKGDVLISITKSN